LTRYAPSAAVACGTALVASATAALPLSERLVLGIASATVLAWAFALTDESRTGIASVFALWMAGAIDGSRITAASTDKLILLLVAAYVIAFSVERAGLLGVIAARLFSKPMPFSRLCWRLAVFVGATAFVIPSTSARAAILLPIHRAMVASLPDDATRRALAVLVPTIILLSAGGVLTGAAAHVVALKMIVSSGGPQPGYGQWLLLALPVALFTCTAAVWLVLRLVAGRNCGRRPVAAPAFESRTLNGSDRAILVILSATVLLWLTGSWHGAGLASVGAVGAVLILLLVHTRHPVSASGLAKAIDWKVIAMLISTVLLADALLTSGAVARLADGIMRAIPGSIFMHQALLLGVVAAVAMLSHLALPSRSARAAVLLPALALPLAGAGQDMATLSLVIVLGTGFCQLVSYGAKPLMIFAGQTEPAEFRKDLARLGLPLFALFWLILVACALTLWPLLDFPALRRGTP
jgi:di/tricarboxylate transporter